MLLVLGDGEDVKTKMFEVKSVNELGVSDLARGGLGRLTIYTEKAVKDLENKFLGKLNVKVEKKVEGKKWD